MKLPPNQVNNSGFNKATNEKKITHKGKRLTKALKQINLIFYINFNRSTLKTPLILICLPQYNLQLALSNRNLVFYKNIKLPE